MGSLDLSTGWLRVSQVSTTGGYRSVSIWISSGLCVIKLETLNFNRRNSSRIGICSIAMVVSRRLRTYLILILLEHQHLCWFWLLGKTPYHRSFGDRGFRDWIEPGSFQSAVARGGMLGSEKHLWNSRKWLVDLKLQLARISPFYAPVSIFWLFMIKGLEKKGSWLFNPPQMCTEIKVE